MADNLQLLDDIGVFSYTGPAPRLTPEVAREIAAELRSLREKAAVLDSRWTLVSEQPPEADRRVLVLMCQGGVTIAKRLVLGEPYDPRYHGVVEWENDDDQWLIPHPVKWMPLPEGQP